MSASTRIAIAKIQADLVRGLVQGNTVPPGFDVSRVRAAARSLVNKRRQALSRCWPSLIQRLGESFTARFTEYATENPMPVSANAFADGRAFLAWLAAKGPLSDPLHREALAYDLRWRETKLGLSRRSGVGVKLAKLGQSGKWVLGLRLPWFGERWWGMPQMK